jgi:hypothetical protein
VDQTEKLLRDLPTRTACRVTSQKCAPSFVAMWILLERFRKTKDDFDNAARLLVALVKKLDGATVAGLTQ